jgi:hypothetical protein
MKNLNFALFSLGLCMACNSPTPSVTVVDSGVSSQCNTDDDCPDPALFSCSQAGVCVPSCRAKPDCGAARRGQYAIAACDSAQLGCQCDEGRCITTLCSSDSECGAQVCRNGACAAAPAASEAVKCSLSPDFVVLKKGAKATFSLSAYKADGSPVVLKEGATFTVPAGSPLTGSGTGLSVEFSASQLTTGTAPIAAVQAAAGGATCQASAVVLPAAASAGKVAVVAVDELSGRPVAGADVLVSKADGRPIEQPAVKTDAKGFAEAVSGAPAAYTVSVFHPDYTYVTVANYSGAANYLSFVMRRNQVDKFGGFKGTYPDVQRKDVQLAITGMSLAGSITNLSITQLLGPSVPKNIMVAGLNLNAVPVPAGVYLGFGTDAIKNDVAGQGLAGTCLDARGASDEATIASGSCGTRSVWSLGATVPVAQLLPFASLAGGGAALNINDLLTNALPLIKTFKSTVTRDVKFALKNTPRTNGQFVLTDQADFTTLNQEFPAVPLGFNFAVKLPELPKFGGTYIDGAAIIGGSLVPGRGVVPLGLGAAVNQGPVDGQTDVQGGLPAGLVGMRMAPNHHGLEGSTYGLVIAGVSASALTSASAGAGVSAIFARIPDNKLRSDATGANPVDVSMLKFPAYPEGARFNFASVGKYGIVTGRTFKPKAAIDFAASGITVLRVSFADDLEHRWDVLVDAASAQDGFVLPSPPGVNADRLLANSMMNSERSTLLVQTLRLSAKPATPANALSFVDFVEFNDTNAERTTELLTGFSFIDYGKPGVEFTVPKESPGTVATKSKLALTMKSFQLGTDGKVKLSFSNATGPVVGCGDAATADGSALLSMELMPGNGKVEYALPATCLAQMGLKVKAELVESTGAALVPPASKSIELTLTP